MDHDRDLSTETDDTVNEEDVELFEDELDELRDLDDLDPSNTLEVDEEEV